MNVFSKVTMSTATQQGHIGKSADNKDDDSKENEIAIDPKQALIDKENEINLTLDGIQNGLKSIESSTKKNVALVEREFEDLINKLKLRRDKIIKSLNEIAFDKEQILTKQASDLQIYQKQIAEENTKAVNEIDVKLADKNVSIATKPEIFIDIDNDKLSRAIATMGDVNNTFPPNPPKIVIQETKAHTCKVLGCFVISFSL